MKILIPVEDEKHAAAQVKFAIEHKWEEPVSFNILHAVEPLVDESYNCAGEPFFDRLYSWKKERGIALISDLALALRKAFPKADIVETIEADHPGELILDVADNWGADVIVIGAHGKPINQRLGIGSVSSVVLAYGKCQVIVVRPAKETLQYTGRSKRKLSENAAEVRH